MVTKGGPWGADGNGISGYTCPWWREQLRNDDHGRCHPESGDGEAGSSGGEWPFSLRTQMLALDLERSSVEQLCCFSENRVRSLSGSNMEMVTVRPRWGLTVGGKGEQNLTAQRPVPAVEFWRGWGVSTFIKPLLHARWRILKWHWRTQWDQPWTSLQGEKGAEMGSYSSDLRMSRVGQWASRPVPPLGCGGPHGAQGLLQDSATSVLCGIWLS